MGWALQLPGDWSLPSLCPLLELEEERGGREWRAVGSCLRRVAGGSEASGGGVTGAAPSQVLLAAVETPVVDQPERGSLFPQPLVRGWRCGVAACGPLRSLTPRAAMRSCRNRRHSQSLAFKLLFPN